MAAEKLRGRMYDDIGAMLEGADQVGRRHGVVDMNGCGFSRSRRSPEGRRSHRPDWRWILTKMALVLGVIAASKVDGSSESAQTTFQPKFL